jgi:hypothetical protein
MKFGDGKGAVQSISRKQKFNSKSSTESELVGADDVSIMILWTKLFLEEQGKRTRALNIRYFFLTDQVQQGHVAIEYCPTNEMVGDFHTKPLQGE